MADFRDYMGVDASKAIAHYGVGHDKGGHSGRYPWGSGNRSKQRSDSVKIKSTGKNKVLKTAAVVTAAALATYGAYKLYQHKELISFGKKSVRKYGIIAGASGFDNIEPTKTKTETTRIGSIDANSTPEVKEGIRRQLEEAKKAGFKELKEIETEEERLERVNPYEKNNGGSYNCTSCSFAGFLRIIGLDAIAKPMNFGQDSVTLVETVIKNRKGRVFGGEGSTASKFGRSEADAAEMILKRFNENGALGVAGVALKDTPQVARIKAQVSDLERKGHTFDEIAQKLNFTPDRLKQIIKTGGHMFCWKVIDGRVEFMDYQSKRLDGIEANNIFGRIDTTKEFICARLDGAEFNYDELVKQVLKN